MRESARNDISRNHAKFAHVHKCEQNTTQVTECFFLRFGRDIVLFTHIHLLFYRVVFLQNQRRHPIKSDFVAYNDYTESVTE